MNRFHVTAILLGLISTAVEARELSYKHFYLGYERAEIEDTDIDLKGFSASGSLPIQERMFITLNYSSVTSDDIYIAGYGSDEMKLTSAGVGVGFNTPIAEKTDFVGKVGFSRSDVEFFDEKVDATGRTISLGVRSLLTDNIELNGFINHAAVEIDDEDEDEVFFSIAARFFLTGNFSMGIATTTADADGGPTIDFRIDL